MLELNKVYCGDCLKVMKELPDKCVDAVITDPPYGHNNNNGDLISRREAALGTGNYIPERDNNPIANDGPEADNIFRAALPELYRIMKPGSCICCCCGGGGPDPQFARWSLWMDEVFEFKQMVVWDKGPIGMGWHYRRSYETILVAKKHGSPCKWYDTTGSVENIIRPSSGIKKIIPQSGDHQTPKPTSLAGHFINLHTQPHDIILDPFCGYGWVGLSAIGKGRNFIGIEIDLHYCEIAQKRIDAELAQTNLLAEPLPQPTQEAMKL